MNKIILVYREHPLQKRVFTKLLQKQIFNQRNNKNLLTVLATEVEIVAL